MQLTGKTRGGNLLRQTLQRHLQKGIFQIQHAVAQAAVPLPLDAGQRPHDTWVEQTDHGLVFRHPVTKLKLCIAWQKQHLPKRLEVTIECGKATLVIRERRPASGGCRQDQTQQATFLCLNHGGARVRPMSMLDMNIKTGIHQSRLCQKLPGSRRIVFIIIY